MLRAPRALPYPISSFDFFADVNLDIRNVLPQCYDGVTNMSNTTVFKKKIRE